MEQTYVMLKPDAVNRGLAGEIISRIEKKGFSISAMTMLVMTEEKAKAHYYEHVEKPFFPELLEYITSGPVIGMVVSGPNVIRAMRKMLGATDPFEADPGSIRGDYGFSKTMNLVHASDSPESAAREIALYFTSEQICG